MNYTLATSFDAIKKAYLGKPFKRFYVILFFFTEHIAWLENIN